jgi:hypothetical protein
MKVKDAPDSLILFELCSKFGKLPSEIMAEDNQIIEEFMFIISEMNERERKASKKMKGGK